MGGDVARSQLLSGCGTAPGANGMTHFVIGSRCLTADNDVVRTFGTRRAPRQQLVRPDPTKNPASAPHAKTGPTTSSTTGSTSIPHSTLMLHFPPILPLTGNRLRSIGPPQRIPPPPRHQIRPLRYSRNQHRLPMSGQYILAHRRHLLPIPRPNRARQRYPRARSRGHRFFADYSHGCRYGSPARCSCHTSRLSVGWTTAQIRSIAWRGSRSHTRTPAAPPAAR